MLKLAARIPQLDREAEPNIPPAGRGGRNNRALYENSPNQLTAFLPPCRDHVGLKEGPYVEKLNQCI